MVPMDINSIFVSCFILALFQFGSVQLKPDVWSSFATGINTFANSMVNAVVHPYSETLGFIKSQTTKDLCRRNTDQLIEYYGYKSEVHIVTTKDGYILTVFRCNSNKAFSGTKRAVILQHGIFSSSDDFTVNVPNQSLAYILADIGYDVFVSNSRGNFYSRQHLTLETSDPQFWNFTIYEMAIYDYPAVIDYVRNETGNDKVFIVAHSQGTTLLMALLSELPEYNRYVAAASLMAPVGYLSNSGILITAISRVTPLLELFKFTELLPRPGISDIAETFCSLDITNFCGFIIDEVFGQSVDQRNDSMMNAFLCKVPSGAATMQLLQFSQEVNYGFFGKYMEGSNISGDFNLSRINIPISLHYSPIDKFTNPKDFSRLISKLEHTVDFVQTIESPQFNHIDFIWGKTAASIIYSKIVEFFAKYH